MAACLPHMQDQEVIDTYLATQQNPCFNILHRRYAGKVYSKCLSMLKDEALANDATQEIFVKLLTNLWKFQGRSKFSTWVYSITYNYCIDFLRRRKKRNNLFADELDDPPDMAEEDVPDEFLLQMEIKQLREVLKNLPDDDKAVLLMKYQSEMSIKEIAELLNKTESAVKMKIKRAKVKAKRLRSEMFEEVI